MIILRRIKIRITTKQICMFAVTRLSLLKRTNLHENYICCIKNYIKKTYTSLLKNQSLCHLLCHLM